MTDEAKQNPLKKIRRKAKKKAKQQCKRHGDECTASVQAFCAQNASPSDCLDRTLPCCRHMAVCDGGLGVICVIDAIS